MKDSLTFRKMVSPVIIQILFWSGMLALVGSGAYDTIAGVRQGRYWEIVLGVATLLIGPLLLRMYCELCVLFFRMNEALTDIRTVLVRPGPAGQLQGPAGLELELPRSTPDRAPGRRWMPPEMR